MDNLSSSPATTQPVITSADSEGSGSAAITVASKIPGTDTVTVAAGDTKNEMPDSVPGDGVPDDAISDKTVKETCTNAQMTNRETEKTSSDDTVADTAVNPEELSDKGQLESVTEKVQTIQTDDSPQAPLASEESTRLEGDKPIESDENNKEVDESSKPEETATTVSNQEGEEKGES